LKTLFRRKAKSAAAGTQPLLDGGCSSEEHLTQTASSHPESPEQGSAHKTLKHKRSEAELGLPEIMLIEEDPLPHTIEPFPRYSHSFDITRYMQDHYPQIVVTPASVEGDPEERVEKWLEI